MCGVYHFESPIDLSLEDSSLKKKKLIDFSRNHREEGRETDR